MVSIQMQTLCISIVFFTLALGGTTNAEDASPHTHHHHHIIKGSNVTHHYTKAPTRNHHTYHYTKAPTVNHHTYHYTKPPTVNHHKYRIKKNGTVHHHSYRYKKPGTVHHHHYRYRVPHKRGGPPEGFYHIANVIHNYFNLGGHLTGIPAMDFILLRYFIAQGPKNFCPSS